MHVFSGDLRTLDTDLVILPVFEGERAPEPWSAATGGEIARALGSKEFCGALYEIFFAPVSDRSVRAGRVALVGAGAAGDFTTLRARRIATAAALQARQRKTARMAFALDGRLATAETAQSKESFSRNFR